MKLSGYTGKAFQSEHAPDGRCKNTPVGVSPAAELFQLATFLGFHWKTSSLRSRSVFESRREFETSSSSLAKYSKGLKQWVRTVSVRRKKGPRVTERLQDKALAGSSVCLNPWCHQGWVERSRSHKHRELSARGERQ